MRALQLVVLGCVCALLLPAQSFAAPRRILSRSTGTPSRDALTTAIARRWAADDAPIARGAAQQTWTWGPQIYRSGAEPYAEAPDGQRATWYFDKARMEITQPAADAEAPWFVTTGLLVREMISGAVQIGDMMSEQRAPADIPVAGDLQVAPDQAITYRDLQPLASLNSDQRAPSRVADEAIVTEVIRKTGSVQQDERLLQYEVYFRAYNEVLGHNVPDVFVQALPADQLLYIAGRPLTEPYWASVQIGGAPQDVLMQAFERRVLTYTPSNPAGWQVEWGNVGRQYAQWRYGVAEAGLPVDPQIPLYPDPVIRPLAELAPAAVQTINGRGGRIAAAVLDVQTGELWSINGTQPMQMFSTVKVAIMLGVLDRALREHRAVTGWEDQALRAMIQESSNAAASDLLASIGGAARLEAYLRSIGLRKTTIDRAMWGYSTTTVQDMTQLMAKLADCTILNAALCTYALDLMRNVEPDQAWGVSAGVRQGMTVALKNGWSPEARGWTINSLGYVAGNGQRYTIAIYTSRNNSKAYGITTIERVARAIYAALP